MNRRKLVNWGIIGCGKHASTVMIPAFSDCRTSNLCALASQSPARSARLRKQYPHLRVYESYQEAIEDDSVTALYIGLPNHLHASWSIKALEAGKHVLCEKPIAVSSQEARAMQEAARKAKRFCVEAFMYRFHPQYEVLREMLSSDELGEVQLLEGHFQYSLKDYGNIRWNRQYGGGALYDVGCYILDAAHFLLNSPLELGSARARIHPDLLVDESVFAQLYAVSSSKESSRTENSTVVHLSASANLPRQNSLSLHCSKGIVELNRAFRMPRYSDAILRYCLLADGKWQQRRIPAANQYALELDTFSRKILGERVDEGLFSDGIQTLEAIEKIRRAIARGK